MSKFTIEVCPEGFVALRVYSEDDFFSMVRDVIAGRVEGADCVYYVCSKLEYTWYEGEDYEVSFKVETDYWDQTFDILPKWVLEG